MNLEDDFIIYKTNLVRWYMSQWIIKELHHQDLDLLQKLFLLFFLLTNAVNFFLWVLLNFLDRCWLFPYLVHHLQVHLKYFRISFRIFLKFRFSLLNFLYVIDIFFQLQIFTMKFSVFVLSLDHQFIFDYFLEC